MVGLSSWFQFGAIPSDALQGSYEPYLVVLSYVIAVLASYVALVFVGRLRSSHGRHAKIYWLAGGAFTMGAGIWSMHFIGMLAFILPMPMAYEMGWTAASLLMAILASALALFILQKHSYSFMQFILGGFLLGLAISTMHYLGMQGMKFHLNIHYLPGLFFLSIVIGIIAAEAAIYLALQSNKGSKKRQAYLKMISALIMGLAICGMHYTGMAAAVFTMNPEYTMASAGSEIQPGYLAFFVAGITLLLTGMALIASSSYKKMITVIKNEKDFLNAMLNNLEDGIIACNANGVITVFNRTLRKNVENYKDRIHFDELSEYVKLMTLDNKVISNNQFPLQKVLNEQPVHGVEYILQFNNKTERNVIIDAQKIINIDGKNLGAVAVIHDITELKKTERLKKEFVSIVSHELRTPLTSIRGSLGLLVSGVMGKFPEKANELLHIANNNCERLLLLINDILDIEKIEAGKMEFKLKNVDLNQLIIESISTNKMYADKFDLSIELVNPEHPVMVLVDPDRLLQVMANLISNAAKFSPRGDKIKITIKQANDLVRVSIHDHGVGIPDEFQSRIFQKFSQADSSDSRIKGGTGLGLNISKTIIEQLNGTLNFTCNPKKGTTFYFELPIFKDIKELAPKEEVVACSAEAKRLLVCEDDEDQAEYLKALLESAGYIVDTAFTVTSANELLREHEYHALLLDLILPDQDGITFIRELRTNEWSKDIDIIVISVIAETGQSILNGDALSVVDWLDKPIDFNQLLSSLTRIKRKNDAAMPTILHIEDNRDMQYVVSKLLEDYAFVFAASDLHQAKELLDYNEYDLIILDLILPDGNGSDILPLLAQYRAPVLVFSDMELNEEYAEYVSRALVKSKTTNETLLNTIIHLL